MTFEKWSAVITHLFVLCGVRKMDEVQHGYYVSAMFAELKEKFTDDEIGIAARQIAETETLYGAYPSLALWLKYAPAERLRLHNENANVAEIKDFLMYITECAECYLDPVAVRADMVKKFGDRIEYVLDEFGGVKGFHRNTHNQSQFVKEQAVQDFIKAWTRSETDVKMNIPQLAENQTLQITKGGDNE